MQTRSSSRLVSNPSSNPTPSTNPNPKGRNPRRSKQRIEDFNLEELSPPIVTMADQCTMTQLLQAPTEGYEDAIVVPLITADNFELKHGLLTLVQNKQLHQLDTFYNALNLKDQDSLNSAAGGNFLDKMPRECLAIIESNSKVCYSRNKPVVAKVSTNTSTSGISPDVSELKDMVKALLLEKKSQNQAPAPVKAVEESCVTCGGAHSYCNCPATDGNIYRDNIQEFISQASVVNYNQGNTNYRPPMMSNQIRPPGFPPANDEVMRNMKTQCQNMQNQLNNLTDLITKFVNSNGASTSSSGTLPSNTISNSKSDLKAITNLSGVSYDGPQIPPSISFLPKVVENKTEATKGTVDPTNNGSTKNVNKLPEKLGDPGKFLILCDFPGMAECLALADHDASINLMPFSVWKRLSLLDLTPTCMTLELPDRSTSHPLRVAEDVYVKVGSFYFLADFVVVDFDADPRVPLILRRSFLKTERALTDVFEDLPPHFEYEFLEGDDKLPVIITKDLSMEDKTALITVLKTHKRAIAWKLSDIKGIDPEFYTHKILMEEEFEPAVQHQRRVNPKIHDVIKQEVIKVLEAGLIYPVSDSPWVSPMHCVPKKRGFTVVENEDNELIPTRLVMGWRVCIDYRKLNEATRKDHFPLPFMDQMLERLAGNQYCCFLDGFSGTFQRCMMAIFHDMIKKTMEVFMDDFSIFRNSFQSCLSHLERMLKRCEDTNLCLNWEKSHFMVKEVDYLSKWVEAKALPTNDARVVCKFLKNLFARFETPRAIISNRGTHFCNDQFAKVMQKYGVTHRLATLYHPQTSGQVEVSNRGLKRILKRSVGENHASWSDKLNDDLWVFCAAYKTPIGCTLYKLVYGLACHLPIELEHKAYWALKHVNFDIKTAGDHGKVQINKLNELCDQAYENSLIFKEKTKRLHDSKIKNHVFNIGDRVLIFNSRLNIFFGKLKSRWSGPFTIS
nr:reverse transcriptase domain-containing protein [Tanacetum cinerariifolium]